MSTWDAAAETWFAEHATSKPLPEGAARLIAAILAAAQTRTA